MKRADLEQLIQKEIQQVTHEYLRDLKNQNKVQQTTDYLNSSSISEDEVEHALFHGGRAPEKKEKKTGLITLREGLDSNLKITVSEIKEFENSFKEILDNIPGASIVFDKQSNGYSIIATKRADGVEAKASGILNLGDKGKITWVYSILNGFNINAQNLKLSQNNKTMFEALTNHYDDWQKKWREKLNLPGAVEQTAKVGMQPDLGALPGGAGLSGQEPAGSTGAQGAPAPSAPVV